MGLFERLSLQVARRRERVVVGHALHLSVSLRFALKTCLLFEIDAVDNKKINE